jgi:hypothetical protein
MDKCNNSLDENHVVAEKTKIKYYETLNNYTFYFNSKSLFRIGNGPM